MAESIETHYKERVASIEEAIGIAEEYRKMGKESERRGNYESAKANYTNALKILGEAYERVKNTNDERENEIRRR
jgi:predicted metal-dependent hydrolase